MGFSAFLGGNTSLQLKKAFFLYSGKTETIEDFTSSSLLVEHEIMPGNKLGAGRAVDGIELVKTFENDYQKKFGTKNLVIPEKNILAHNSNSFVFYMPTQMKVMFFRTADDALNSLNAKKFMQPSLIFKIIDDSIYVRAYKGKSKPTKRTQLYAAPYYNVNPTSGVLCQGTSVFPKTLKMAEFKSIYEIFFTSAFTHANGAHLNYSGSIYEFWLSCEKEFNNKGLLKLGRNLEQWL